MRAVGEPDDGVSTRPVVTTTYVSRIVGFEHLRVLRHGLGRWLDDLGAEEPFVADVVLAVTEIATNAIEASPVQQADVRAELDGDLVKVQVANEGPPFDGRTSEPDERGRGLHIAAALMDALSFHRNDGRTEAVLLKRC